MRFRGNFQVPSPLGLEPVGDALRCLLVVIAPHRVTPSQGVLPSHSDTSEPSHRVTTPASLGSSDSSSLNPKDLAVFHLRDVSDITT